MADMADTKKPKPIPYWGYFANGGTFDYDPSRSEPGQQFLSGIQQFDPNARFVNIGPLGGEGSAGVDSYQLQYDPTLLPSGGPGSHVVDINPGDYAPQNWSPLDLGETFDQYRAKNPGAGNFQGIIKDPNAVTTNPYWGRTTPTNNVDWAAMDRSNMDWMGPLMVAGFAFGAPLLASAMSNGALGAAASGAAASGGAAAGGGVGDGSLMPMIPTDPASLYTPMLPFNPADPSLALNGVTPAMAAGTVAAGTQAAAPITEAGTPARVMDVIRSGHLPGPANIGQSLSEITPSQLLRAAGSILHGVGGTAAGAPGPLGGGGGGGGLLGGGGGNAEDAMAILARFYGVPQDNMRRLLTKARNG